MLVIVSIKVRREIVDLADKMVKYGLARSRSHAFNIMIMKGLEKVLEEITFWESVYDRAEEYRRVNYVIRHGGLSRLLEEGRSR